MNRADETSRTTRAGDQPTNPATTRRPAPTPPVDATPLRDVVAPPAGAELRRPWGSAPRVAAAARGTCRAAGPASDSARSGRAQPRAVELRLRPAGCGLRRRAAAPTAQRDARASSRRSRSLVLVLASGGVGAVISAAVHRRPLDRRPSRRRSSAGSNNDNAVRRTSATATTTDEHGDGDAPRSPSKVSPALVNIYTTIDTGAGTRRGRRHRHGHLVVGRGAHQQPRDRRLDRRSASSSSRPARRTPPKVLGYNVNDDVALLQDRRRLRSRDGELRRRTRRSRSATRSSRSATPAGAAATPAVTSGSVTALDQKVTAGDQGTGHVRDARRDDRDLGADRARRLGRPARRTPTAR